MNISPPGSCLYCRFHIFHGDLNVVATDEDGSASVPEREGSPSAEGPANASLEKVSEQPAPAEEQLTAEERKAKRRR